MLLLELGDFLKADIHEGAVINPLLLDRMEAEGTAAVLPGVIELTQWEWFQQLMAGRSLPVLLSNVARVAGEARQPLAERTLIAEAGGVRVGLIGVLGRTEFGEIPAVQTTGLELADPRATVIELAPELGAQCDLVAVMACMSDRDAFSLASELGGVVDLVLGGRGSIASDRPIPAGEVLVSRSGMTGQYLNLTRLIVSPEGRIIDWFGRNHQLTAAYPADPVIDSLVAQAQLQAAFAKRRGEQSAMPEVAPTGPAPAALAGADSPGAAPPRLIGAAACGSCHSAQHRHWSGTAHAPSVSCEACHGPANLHARDGSAPAVTEAVCRGCHSGTEWDPTRALGVVRH